MNILVTSSTFGEKNKKPKEMLKRIKNLKVTYNKTGKKYTKKSLMTLLKKYNPIGIIAGTEEYDSEVLNCCKNLKAISRIGVGLDSVDLIECKKRKIKVKNTPNAPVNAVAEIVIGQIINLTRRIQESDKNIRKKIWKKHIGKEIKDCVIGIIGCGRTGSAVFNKISTFNPKKILTNDLIPKRATSLPGSNFSSKEEIIKKCDIITIHIPLNKRNKDYLSKKEFDLMKNNLIILNFSRGGIINEDYLYLWLKRNPEARAAIDTFEEEPYIGKLIKLNNCYLTSHIGGYSEKSRLNMEREAVKNLLKELKNIPNIPKSQHNTS